MDLQDSGRIDGVISKCRNENRFIKIAAIIAVNLIILALITVAKIPAIGYEASIYKSTPIIFWISLILSFTFGIIIIVYQIYNQEYKKHNFWMIGLILIFLSYAMSLSLYIMRGYYMWTMSGDPATHLGYIKQMMTDGFIPEGMFYPILHIYTTELLQILNIDVLALHKLFPLFFGLLYIPFMYLFSKSILSNKGQIILATVASSTLIQGWYLNFTPNHLSNLYFPLLFFILIKTFEKKKVAWKILLLIMVFLYPTFHPVPTLALIIILVALWLPKRVFNLFNKELKIDATGLGTFNITLLTILFVWGISWISSFYIWESTIRNVNTLINEGGPSHISKLGEQVTYAQGYGFNVYEQVLKVMGGSIVYIILTIISLPIIWNWIRSNKEVSNLFLLYGPFSIMSVFILSLFFFNIGFGPLRMTIYIDIITTIFVGFILHEIIIKSRNVNRKYLSKFASGLAIILLVGVFLSGMMKLYPSPYILTTNYQTTQTEVEGMDWFFNNRNLCIEISGISTAPGRFADFLLTPEEKSIQKVPYYLSQELFPPYHFGYDNNSYLSDSYEKDIYFVIIDKDKSVYIDIFPDMAEFRWFATDFEKLECDLSVDKLYSNDGFDMFYVKNQKG